MKKQVLNAWYYLQKLNPDKYRVRMHDGKLITSIWGCHYYSPIGFREKWWRVNPETLKRIK